MVSGVLPWTNWRKNAEKKRYLPCLRRAEILEMCSMCEKVKGKIIFIIL